MNVCPECSSHLVEPLSWSELEDGDWLVSLRCPECEWRGTGAYGHLELQEFEEELELATSSICSDIAVLTAADRAQEVERFRSALQDGQILPSDF